MSKVTLQGHIIVPDAELEIVKAALVKHIGLTRQEPGCIVFEVIQVPEQLNRFNVYEEFVDQAAFDQHQQRVRDSDWGRITVNVERHYHIS